MLNRTVRHLLSVHPIGLCCLTLLTLAGTSALSLGASPYTDGKTQNNFISGIRATGDQIRNNLTDKPIAARAAVTATSPAQADVQTAINSATAGDTIYIPAGTATSAQAAASGIALHRTAVAEGA